MVTLTISPQDALIDVPRRICVTGLAQGVATRCAGRVSLGARPQGFRPMHKVWLT